MKEIDYLTELMCAVAVRRLKHQGMTAGECLQVTRDIADKLRVALRSVVDEEIPEAVENLVAAGQFSPERFSILTTALAASRAVEIADGIVYQQACQSK